MVGTKPAIKAAKGQDMQVRASVGLEIGTDFDL